MAVNYKEKYQNLLMELIDFRNFEKSLKEIESEVNRIRDKQDTYEGEYKNLSRQEKIKKYWCQELLKTRFTLSTLIVVSCSLMASFFGGLWIGNLLKITSDIVLFLMSFVPSIIIGSIEYYFLYQKRVNDDKYLREELENNEEYQKILEQLRGKEGQIKTVSRDYEKISQQKENASLELDTKKAIISSLIDTLGIESSVDENLDVGTNSQSYNALVRRRIKNDEVAVQAE